MRKSASEVIQTQLFKWAKRFGTSTVIYQLKSWIEYAETHTYMDEMK